MAISREAFSDAVLFLALVLCALIVDGVLHFAGRPDLGRYFGYWGTLLILVSFVHSARKRDLVSWGRPTRYLRVHEFLAWIGALMVLVHGGIHFNALLPWLAMVAMLIAVASGLTGKFLLRKSRTMMKDKRRGLMDAGLSDAEVEERLYWDSLLVGLMQKWRVVHLPITATFAFLAVLHIVTVVLFWRW